MFQSFSLSLYSLFAQHQIILLDPAWTTPSWSWFPKLEVFLLIVTNIEQKYYVICFTGDSLNPYTFFSFSWNSALLFPQIYLQSMLIRVIFSTELVPAPSFPTLYFWHWLWIPKVWLCTLLNCSMDPICISPICQDHSKFWFRFPRWKNLLHF